MGGKAKLSNILFKINKNAALSDSIFVKKWQGKKASNPRPTVLETAALPTELFPYIKQI